LIELMMIELKYFPSNFFKVQMTEEPLAFRRLLLLSSNLPMKAGWADKSGDTWFAMYERDGVLTFRAGAWTCPIDANAVCSLVDGPAGAAVFSVSVPGQPVFEHRYTFAKWKKLAQPGYAQDGRLADDFFAWVADIWNAKQPV
jgi:hypothetical protein